MSIVYVDPEFKPDKFKVFVRYMIQVAKGKRCVPFIELENTFGLSHLQAGYYAGILADYCLLRKIPPLSGLIINTRDFTPSKGFDWYLNKHGKSWGNVISDCWKKYHVKSTREKQFKDFSHMDGDIEEYLINNNLLP